jgi:hypothetical protein
MRKITIAAVLLVGLAGTAYAQQQQKVDPEEVAKARAAAALDKQYRAILELTDKSSGPVKVDPWQNMRGASSDASKPKH